MYIYHLRKKKKKTGMYKAEKFTQLIFLMNIVHQTVINDLPFLILAIFAPHSYSQPCLAQYYCT